MNCNSCGAGVEITMSMCPYCGMAVEGDMTVGAEQVERLEAVARSMEEVFKSDDSGSPWLALSFLVLSGLSVGSYFFYASLLPSSTTIWILTLFSTAVFFLTFGFTVQLSEKVTYNRIYEQDVKVRINQYLVSMNIPRYSFDMTADRVLDSKAILRRFLFKR